MSDFAITAPYAEWLALVCIAWRVPGKLLWDSKNLRFTNSAEANRYVKPVFRKGKLWRRRQQRAGGGGRESGASRRVLAT